MKSRVSLYSLFEPLPELLRIINVFMNAGVLIRTFKIPYAQLEAVALGHAPDICVDVDDSFKDELGFYCPSELDLGSVLFEGDEDDIDPEDSPADFTF